MSGHTIRFTTLSDRELHRTITDRCANAQSAGVILNFNYGVQQPGMMTYEIRYADR